MVIQRVKKCVDILLHFRLLQTEVTANCLEETFLADFGSILVHELFEGGLVLFPLVDAIALACEDAAEKQVVLVVGSNT